MDNPVPQDLLASAVTGENLEKLVLLGDQVLLDQVANLDHLDSQVQLAKEVNLDSQDLVVKEDSLDRQDLLDHEENLVLEVTRDCLDLLDKLELQGREVNLDYPAKMVSPDHKVLLDNAENLDHEDKMVHQDSQVSNCTSILAFVFV